MQIHAQQDAIPHLPHDFSLCSHLGSFWKQVYTLTRVLSFIIGFTPLSQSDMIVS